MENTSNCKIDTGGSRQSPHFPLAVLVIVSLSVLVLLRVAVAGAVTELVTTTVTFPDMGL